MNHCSRFYFPHMLSRREILFGVVNWAILVSAGYFKAFMRDDVDKLIPLCMCLVLRTLQSNFIFIITYLLSIELGDLET